MHSWNVGSSQNSLRQKIEAETKKLDMSEWVENRKKEKQEKPEIHLARTFAETCSGY